MVLLGGCLALGVLGAAKCLLSSGPGPRNTAYLNSAASDGDIIAVTVTRKISSITDAPDLTATEPLLVLTRERAGTFTVRLDNTARHPGG